MPKKLIDLPSLLYNISKDIEVSDKFTEFGLIIGLTLADVKIIQDNSSSVQFPSYQAIMRWLCKSPDVSHLAHVLYKLNLERSLERLKDVDPQIYEEYSKRMQFDRDQIKNKTNLGYYSTEGYQNESVVPRNSFGDEQTLNNNNSGNNSSFSHTTSSKNSENLQNNNDVESRCKISHFEFMLQQKSTVFLAKEFNTDDLCRENELEISFATNFPTKLRGIMFNVQSFSLTKINESQKKQRKLYNIIWSLTNYKLPSLPLLVGYSFVKDHLFLIYPGNSKISLFTILHDPRNCNGDVISSQRRLSILREIGETLIFLHSSEPFPVYHGRIVSQNVQISSDGIILTGFEKCHTDDVAYQKGLEIIEKRDIKAKDYKRKDVLQYLKLIYEIWWNIQSCNIESLTKASYDKPTVKYPGWCERINSEISQVITKHSDSRMISSIFQIVDDLLKIEEERAS